MRLVSLVLGFVLAGLLACGREPTPPNIVLVIGDDHGYTDFGFMGSPIAHTPELDRLAQEGVAFTHGFNTSSACRNSLLSMLTGLHPIQWDARRQQLLRAGIVHAENQLITEFATLPRLLGERGYVSFQAGKYWEGAFSSGGFDAGTTEPLPDAVVNETGGLPELSGGRGLGIGRSTMEPVFEFLEAERDGPFFLWFAPMLPHLPHNPKPRDLAPYENRRLTDSARLYYGTITRFDRTVSRLLDALRERDLLDETLVVYLADNGWDQRPGYSREGQLDGPRGKKSIYELGFRTPIVFHWPRSIAGGRRFDARVSTVDVFTTLLDVAGAKPPPDRMGRSLWPSVAQG
ncbi:MAG: sulfatase-like hydrolase/transferase, partial [bacterium]|nr:sulfatase-like hydrolase/transferase [bacterium]